MSLEVGRKCLVMMFSYRATHGSRRNLPHGLVAITIAAVLTVITGCGDSGRVGSAHNVPGKWDIWIRASSSMCGSANPSQADSGRCVPARRGDW